MRLLMHQNGHTIKMTTHHLTSDFLVFCNANNHYNKPYTPTNTFPLLSCTLEQHQPVHMSMNVGTLMDTYIMYATHLGGGGPFAGGGLFGGGGFRLSPDGGGGRDPPGGGGLAGFPPPLFPEEGLVGVVMTSLGSGD